MNDMIPDHLGFGDRACPDDAKCQKIAPRWFVLSMLVFLCLGICFRVFEPNQKVLWEDEIAGTIRMLGYTEAEIVRASPSFETAADLQEYFRLRGIGVAKRPDIASTVKSLASEDPQHPPLYYLILHLWVAVFGSSVTAMRSLSIIFSICVLPCIYFLCIELFSSRIAALLGAAIVAVSPFHLLYAQEVREYSLWTVAVIVLSLNFLRALRLRSVSAWAVYGLTLAFSLYVFPLSLLVALGESIYVIILNAVRPSKGIFAYFGAACTAGLAIFVPWLIIMLSSEGLRRGEHSILTTHRSPEKTLVTLIRDVRQIFFDFGSYSSPSWKVIIAELILTLFLGVVVAYACRLILRTGDRRSLVFIVVTLCLPLAPLALYDLVFGGGLVQQSRYFLPLHLGVELLIVAPFSWRSLSSAMSLRSLGLLRSGLLVMLAGGTLSCAIISKAQTWVTKDFEQNRTIAEIVNRSKNPLVVSDFYSSRTLGLGYYLDPSVRLRVDLMCDNCTLRAPARKSFFDANTATGDVFLLGASPQLQHEAEFWARSHPGARVLTIEIITFPDRKKETNPLTLFAPV